MHVQKVHLDAANPRHEIHVPGDYFIVRRASSATATITVHLDAQGETNGLECSEGYGMEGMEFSTLLLAWEAQAGEWVEIVILGGEGRTIGT